MRIKKILIENVGPYKSKEFIFQHPCSLVVDRNEAGKSILANCILEALYPSSLSSTKQPSIPLNNGKIILEIESENEFYQIIRDYTGYNILKNGKPIKCETKNKGRIIRKSPGEIIFNLSREIFINTSFLTQKAGIDMKKLYSITSFLEHAIDTGFQDASASLALTKIKEALEGSIHSGMIFPFNTKGKLDNAIKIWKEKLAEYEKTSSELQNSIKKQTEIIENYAKLLSDLEDINNELNRLETQYATWKIQKDNFYRKEIENLEKRNEELKKVKHLVEFFKDFENLKPEEQQFIILYENEVQNLQKEITSKEHRKKEIKNLLKKTFVINILIAFFSILAGTFGNKIFYSGIILCILILLKQLKLNRENKNLNSEITALRLKSESISKQIDQLISNFSIPVKDRNEFFSLFKEMNMHKKEIKEFIENSKKIEEFKLSLLSENERSFYFSRASLTEEVKEPEKYEQKKDELLSRKDQIKEQIHELQKDYDKIMQQKREIEKLSEQIQSTKKYIETLERFKKALQKSFEVLDKITKKHHELWAEKLNALASQVLSKITNKTANIYFNKDLSFSIKVPEIEYPIPEKEIEFTLSGGMTEQIYLTVRLILAQILSKERKIPFILDEPFAHSDDERFVKGMKYLIQEIANSNQVIILSCHQNRLKLIEELKGSFDLISVSSFSSKLY